MPFRRTWDLLPPSRVVRNAPKSTVNALGRRVPDQEERRGGTWERETVGKHIRVIQIAGPGVEVSGAYHEVSGAYHSNSRDEWLPGLSDFFRIPIRQKPYFSPVRYMLHCDGPLPTCFPTSSARAIDCKQPHLFISVPDPSFGSFCASNPMSNSPPPTYMSLTYRISSHTFFSRANDYGVSYVLFSSISSSRPSEYVSLKGLPTLASEGVLQTATTKPCAAVSYG